MGLETKAAGPTGGRLPLDSTEFRDIIGRFATGVTVITTEYEGRPYGTTASAVSSLSLEPPMLLICMNKSSTTGQALAAAGRFAVNILSEGQVDAAMRFAGKGDKFAGVPVVRGYSGQPLLEEALANLECRVVEEVTGGTHSVFLSAVEHATGRQGPPLAYFRGQFGRLELKQDDDAYHDIRARIMSRELPGSEPLSIDAMAELVDVPRSSAYYALTKLSGEGLVMRTADGLFAVTPLTLDSVSAALAARRAIELGVVESTVGSLSAEQLDDFRAAVELTRPSPGDAFDITHYQEVWARFRRHFIGLVGSEALVDLHRRANTAAMILTATSSRADGPEAHRVAAESGYQFNLRLLAAYEAGDMAAAISVIREHVDDVLMFASRYIEASGGEA